MANREPNEIAVALPCVGAVPGVDKQSGPEFHGVVGADSFRSRQDPHRRRPAAVSTRHHAGQDTRLSRSSAVPKRTPMLQSCRTTLNSELLILRGASPSYSMKPSF